MAMFGNKTPKASCRYRNHFLERLGLGPQHVDGVEVGVRLPGWLRLGTMAAGALGGLGLGQGQGLHHCVHDIIREKRKV